MFKSTYVKAFLVRAAAAAIVAGAVFPVTVSANNPCIAIARSTADPAPCVFNDTLFLYNTRDNDASLAITNIDCYGTTDLVNWKDYGAIMTEATVAWDNNAGHLWAPHVVYFGGRYHLYFPETLPNGTFYIGHAVNTTSPHSMFTPDAQSMLINGSRTGTVQDNGLDPFVIMDTGATGSGNNYLAWCITGITPNRNYIGILSADGASVTGAPIMLRNADFYPDGGHYVEGQWWIKANATWYHIYACYYPGGAEQIGCATSTGTTAGLTGPGGTNPPSTYTWRGWLMGTNQNSAAGTIHPGCANYHNKWYLFWHCGGEEYGGSLLSVGALRSTGAEEFTFNGTAANSPIISTLYAGAANWAVPKTYRGVGIPMAGNYPVADTINVDRRSNITATTYAISGATIARQLTPVSDLGHIVTTIGVGAWVRYDSVNFTPAPGRVISGVQARVASTAARTIEVRQGTNTGTLLGTINVASTGSLTTYTTTANALLTTIPATGKASLTLVFPAGTANTMNVNWIQFQTTSAINTPAAGAAASAALAYQRLNKNTFMVNNAAGADVRLFNMRGQEIADVITCSGVDRNLNVNLKAGALSSGSYVLNVTSASGSVRVPFIY